MGAAASSTAIRAQGDAPQTGEPVLVEANPWGAGNDASVA